MSVGIIWRSVVIFNEIIFLKWYHVYPHKKCTQHFFRTSKSPSYIKRDLALSLLSTQFKVYVEWDSVVETKLCILTIIYWAKGNNNFIAYFIKNLSCFCSITKIWSKIHMVNMLYQVLELFWCSTYNKEYEKLSRWFVILERAWISKMIIDMN